MCSENTQVLANILFEHKFANKVVDYRVRKFYPLVDRVIEWMDEFYAKK